MSISIPRCGRGLLDPDRPNSRTALRSPNGLSLYGQDEFAHCGPINQSPKSFSGIREWKGLGHRWVNLPLVEHTAKIGIGASVHLDHLLAIEAPGQTDDIAILYKNVIGRDRLSFSARKANDQNSAFEVHALQCCPK